jgi:hypothetical protein
LLLIGFAKADIGAPAAKWRFVRFFPLRCDRAEWPVYGYSKQQSLVA